MGYPRISTLAAASLLAGMFALAPARAAVVAHWSFDEAASSSSRPNRFADATGSHDAIANDANALSLFEGKAPFGKAVQFNGTADAYLTVPPLSEIQKSSFTVSVWVYPTAVQPMFALTDWPDWKDSGFVFGLETMTGQARRGGAPAQPYDVQIVDFAGNDRDPKSNNRISVVKSTPNRPISLNEWHHLVWVWNRQDSNKGVLTSYLDGNPDRVPITQAKNIKSVDMPALTNQMRIGSREAAAANVAFKGAIDELWVFDEALTPAQIKNLQTTNSLDGSGTAVAIATPANYGRGNNNSTPTTVAAAFVDEDGSAAEDAKPVAQVHRFTPMRVTGIITFLLLAVVLGSYLAWAFSARAKLRAAHA